MRVLASTGAYTTQSASIAQISSRSPDAVTPSGSRPQSSPTSRPTFSGLCTQAPTSSSSGCASTPLIASWPTKPVAHWITRYVIFEPFLDGGPHSREPERARACRATGCGSVVGMADLVIRNGTIVDGTGAPPFRGDVAVTGSTITAVGDVDEHGTREVDAEGLLVTPGFVDIHTHFDGQVTWDPIVAPSSIHGVTTIAMGNCGVGFAPAHVDRHAWLIGLLEGVEDIPGTALAEGLTWDWETFPEYLDALDTKPHTLDVAAHVPHAALRTYVMGDRGANHLEAPTDDELARLAALVGEALEAGAIGFATSRTDVHRTKAGENIGTLTASARELLAIAEVLGSTGLGVTQLISDCYQTTDDEFAESELALIEAFARTSGRPVSFTVQQAYHSPDRWRKIFDRVSGMRARGLDVKPQVAPRPIGVLLGLEATANPFLFTAGFDEVARLPLAERVAALRDPERRRRILDEHATMIAALPDGLFKQISGGFDVMFELSDPVDYELDADWSFGARAACGRDRPGAARLRRAARARRHAAPLHPVVQLRARQLRRHLRDDLHPVLVVRTFRRGRALRRDLRRQHDHLVARRVGTRSQAR